MRNVKFAATIILLQEKENLCLISLIKMFLEKRLITMEREHLDAAFSQNKRQTYYQTQNSKFKYSFELKPWHS